MKDVSVVAEHHQIRQVVRILVPMRKSTLKNVIREPFSVCNYHNESELVIWKSFSQVLERCAMYAWSHVIKRNGSRESHMLNSKMRNLCHWCVYTYHNPFKFSLFQNERLTTTTNSICFRRWAWIIKNYLVSRFRFKTHMQRKIVSWISHRNNSSRHHHRRLIPDPCDCTLARCISTSLKICCVAFSNHSGKLTASNWLWTQTPADQRAMVSSR